jgi:putative transcriptional regulator
MTKAKLGVSEEDTEFGDRLASSLKEALAWKRGEIALPVRRFEPMPAARVKEIRKKVAKSPRDFEQRFGVPARTVEGWEQGRKVDASAQILLRVIEKDPQAVERALADA